MEICNIDFIILWVDGSDPAWLEEFIRYTDNQEGDKRKSRYRDWDNLKYIFRSFEKCTPWVRKIHFVTYGHLPSWLNLEHEKLNVVRHSDFLDKKNLPVFNANPIEVNLHRIPDLAEKFVYFNDDMFMLKSHNSEQFFKNGLPRDMFAFNAISNSMIANIKINDMEVVNKYFDKHEVVKKNFFKMFDLRNNFVDMLKTILLMPWPKITGFYDHHLPQSYLKQTFEDLWEVESEVLNKTSASKVRNCGDVNQYLFRYWNLCKGSFIPKGFKKTHVGWVRNYEDSVKFSQEIISNKNDMVCICDGVDGEEDFTPIKNKINEAFEQIFPEKSKFEK